MGYWSANKGKESYKQWAINKYNYEENGIKQTVIDAALVNFQELYVAIERHSINDGVKYVYALVVILRKDSYGELMEKTMDETMHPYYHNCPIKILKMLSPARKLRVFGSSFRNVKDWRTEVERLHIKLARIKGLKDGDVIKFERPINLRNGESFDTFTVTNAKKKHVVATWYTVKLNKYIFNTNPWVVIK